MEPGKRDESPTKEFVNVIAVHYSEDGRIEPLRIQRADGMVFIVSRVLETKRAASLRAGGAGIRYHCRVANAEDGREFKIFLFQDVDYWFIEVDDRGGNIVCADGTTPRLTERKCKISSML